MAGICGKLRRLGAAETFSDVGQLVQVFTLTCGTGGYVGGSDVRRPLQQGAIDRCFLTLLKQSKIAVLALVKMLAGASGKSATVAISLVGSSTRWGRCSAFPGSGSC